MLYNFGRYVFYLYLKMFYRIKIHGQENIPERKPFIVCANHICWLDPLSVSAALPSSYQIHFMAKKELFKNRIIGYLMHKANVFPVNRNEADYSAIKKAYQLLREGQVIGLFPEGSRSKDGAMQKAYHGAALIAVRSGVPVLPIAVGGPYQLFKPVNVYIGQPIALPPLQYNHKDEKKEKLEEMSYRIMNAIRKLLPES